VNDNEFKKRAAKLEEIGLVLEKLPPEVRAAAFDLISDYVTGSTEGSAPKKKPPAAEEEGEKQSSGGMEEFFGAFDHDKAHENVYLIVAYFYREQGVTPISVDKIRETATNVGLTIPNRPDMTLTNAKENGKTLFKRTGQGTFQPTVHGEAYLKRVYSVRKGKGAVAE
jgi:hypothetical protein